MYLVRARGCCSLNAIPKTMHLNYDPEYALPIMKRLVSCVLSTTRIRNHALGFTLNFSPYIAKVYELMLRTCLGMETANRHHLLYWTWQLIYIQWPFPESCNASHRQRLSITWRGPHRFIVMQVSAWLVYLCAHAMQSTYITSQEYTMTAWLWLGYQLHDMCLIARRDCIKI